MKSIIPQSLMYFVLSIFLSIAFFAPALSDEIALLSLNHGYIEETPNELIYFPKLAKKQNYRDSEHLTAA